MKGYKPAEIERKWQQYWNDHQVYKVTNDDSKPKFYVLDMFPYPSGEGLHVGHPLGYIATDIIARIKKMQGFNVLHPMGYDSFGLPAEQYAIQRGIHPAISTDQNIKRYRAQLENLGFNYDWSRQVATSDPSFYRWTQWIFLQLFDHYYDINSDSAKPIRELVNTFSQSGTQGISAFSSSEDKFSANEWKSFTPKQQDDVLMNYRLAYRKTTYVNWCEALGTVLANDEVKDGVSERGGYPVEKKPMLQWSLRITAYAERLLSGLNDVEWSEALKTMQRNWIGRSEGAQVFFKVAGSDHEIEVFTTRADTIFGATFMVLAPEHDLVAKLTTEEQQEDIDNYLNYVKSRSEVDRMSEVKQVTGVFTGSYAYNPFTKKQIPIWTSEYVLKDYGTGAIMAVPSDDERDQAFAQKFNLEIIDVIDKSEYPDASLHDKLGKMINSGFITGMEVPDAIEKVTQEIENRSLGTRKINYKLRDANFSRQRYWGEPFPIYYDQSGVTHRLADDQLPLELPELDDYKPAGGGKSPLAKNENWTNLPDGSLRETDTMPGFAGSSWYFLRYMDPENKQAFASKKSLFYWRDVDVYIGGTEHAVGHLMYSRFWHKFLYDRGLVPTHEPFKKLVNQGMIQGVIEYMFLHKEKVNGYSRFLCAKIAEMEDVDNFVKIPVHASFVQDYGSPSSYLNLDSIKKFIDWRPEYAEAIFECGHGIFHHGVFSPKNDQFSDSQLYTHSEVGKMSKRYYNVVNPDDIVKEYGADTFRMYEMFLGPIQQAKPWDTKGIDGVAKFLRKFWSLFYNEAGQYIVENTIPSQNELKILHQTIQKVRTDSEKFSFNTCVSAFMVCTNELKKAKCFKFQILEPLVRLLAPFAPHIAEELWQKMNLNAKHITVHHAEYPEYDEIYLKEDFVTYPIAINGKRRGEIKFPANIGRDEIEQAVPEIEVVKKWSEGKTIRKIIVVPGRMVNVVV